MNQGKWAGAETDLTEYLQTLPKNSGRTESERLSAFADRALVRLRLGNETGYRDDCRAIAADLNASLSHATKKSNSRSLPPRLNPWAPAAILLRDGAADYVDDPPSTARLFMPLMPWSFKPMPESWNLRAGYQYRHGKYAEAENSLGLTPQSASDWFLLAMAQGKQGKAEAKASLEAGRKAQAEESSHSASNPSVPDSYGGSRWRYKIIEDELRKEAEKLIEGKK